MLMFRRGMTALHLVGFRDGGDSHSRVFLLGGIRDALQRREPVSGRPFGPLRCPVLQLRDTPFDVHIC